MIYDNKTLKRLNKDDLKIHEKNLIDEMKTNTDYWLGTTSDNAHWAYKVSSNVLCLEQVRKFLY